MKSVTQFLIFLVTSLSAQEIFIQDLNENPGLVPFNMGNAKLFDVYMTASTYINLEDYVNELEKLRSMWRTFQSTVQSKFPSQFYLINDKFNITKSKLNSLLPGKSRIKRFFDSTVNRHYHYQTNNFIRKTYNYLNNERYERLIATLQSGQEKMIKELNEHIMWSKTLERNFNNKFNNLQRELNSLSLRLSTIELFPKIVQFGFALDKINDFLQDVESAVFEAKKGFTHYLAIDEDNLYEIIKDFELSPEQLPFSLSRDNVKRFYDILETRVFATSKGIIFLFSFPVMKKETYKLYELYSVPVRVNDFFQTIVPNRRFLLAHDNGYILTDNECSNLGDIYYCKEHNGFAKKEDMYCLEQIINLVRDFKSCQFTRVNVRDVFVEQLSESFYLVISPTSQKMKTKCRTENIRTISGSYLLDLPKGCSFSIDTSTFMNDEMEDSINNMVPVLGDKINWDEVSPSNNQPLSLDSSLSLNRLQTLKYSQPITTTYNVLIFTLVGLLFCIQMILTALFVQIWIKKRRSKGVNPEFVKLKGKAISL